MAKKDRCGIYCMGEDYDPESGVSFLNFSCKRSPCREALGGIVTAFMPVTTRQPSGETEEQVLRTVCRRCEASIQRRTALLN